MDRKFIYGVAGLMCLVAVFPLPYWFFIFLKLAVTIAGIAGAFELKQQENFLWVLFVGIALLFNPLIPVHLDKAVWFPIDMIVAGSFGWMVFRDEN